MSSSKVIILIALITFCFEGSGYYLTCLNRLSLCLDALVDVIAFVDIDISVQCAIRSMIDVGGKSGSVGVIAFILILNRIIWDFLMINSITEDFRDVILMSVFAYERNA